MEYWDTKWATINIGQNVGYILYSPSDIVVKIVVSIFAALAIWGLWWLWTHVKIGMK